MARMYIPDALRKRVAEAARYRCGYCQSLEEVVGYTLHAEHIFPRALGGLSIEENLWLACSVCNNYKGSQVRAEDPLTKILEPLFNPRTQIWTEHFAWSEDGTFVVGLTPVGRATVVALQMNAAIRVHARRRWITAGWHPPTD